MNPGLAQALVLALGAYLGVGFVFALVYVLLGVSRLDPSADGAGWGFRVLILPGCAALWPLLALRWMRGVGPPAESNAHRDAARAEPRS